MLKWGRGGSKNVGKSADVIYGCPLRQLMDQNKMLLNTKERQEVEVAALNETLEVSSAYLTWSLK